MAGALTDRAPRHNPAVIAVMRLAGAARLALVAAGSPGEVPARRDPGVLRRVGTGLLLATAIRLLPGRAEDAGHTVQVGVHAGATVAPFGFSALASGLGFAGAALTAAGAALAAALLLAWGARLLRAAEDVSPATTVNGPDGSGSAPVDPACSRPAPA
ncbi:hypothetical protein [Spirillospora sp. NPDC047279]|uniref:hypothetical protein n=1 Tax=Spirillospora sp. NPDC047279 TaxID=3155478 RepID=UPI0033DBF1F3